MSPIDLQKPLSGVQGDWMGGCYKVHVGNKELKTLEHCPQQGQQSHFQKNKKSNSSRRLLRET